MVKRLILLLLVFPLSVAAEDFRTLTPPPPRVGVMIEKILDHGRVLSSGSGILLNDHLIVTAAHVVWTEPEHPQVTVILGGWRIPGTVVQIGQRGKLDLALIKIDPHILATRQRSQPDLPICPTNPGPSQAVVVVSKGMTTRAATVSTAITSDGQTPGWTNMLSTGYHPGNSGGGVFNPQSNCLWGIINLELTGTINGHPVDFTAFVPASQLSDFVRSYGDR